MFHLCYGERLRHGGALNAVCFAGTAVRWVYLVILWQSCGGTMLPPAVPGPVLCDGPSARAGERIVMGFASREWQEVPVPMDRNG
jgi:hypothetical protein